MSITEVDPAIAAIERQGAAVMLTAGTFHRIDTAELFEAAGVFLTEELKPMLQEIERTWRPMQKKTHEAHREVVAQRRRYEGPLLQAEQIVKHAMGAHTIEQRRIVAAAEADRLRVAREAAEAEALAEASRLEEAGHAEAAEERISAPVVPVVGAPAPEPPKAEGVSTRMVTRYRITNATAIRRKFLIPDEIKISNIVKQMGADAVEIVGGIEVYEEPVVSARAR